MLAGLLHTNGIQMGRHFRRPLPENPKGFFEEEAFRRVNDRVLRRSGYTVETWHPAFYGISPTDADFLSARRLIERFNGAAESWGWKDPRTCLTLPLWFDALRALDLERSVRILVIKRNIRSVARSLFTRGNTSSLKHGAALCKMYKQALDRSLVQWNKPSILHIRYERILQGSDIQRLERFCGRQLDCSFVEASLNRSATR
jgi:hypothetical protein